MPQVLPQPFPDFAREAEGRYPYGARSEAAVYVGDLLRREVSGLREGTLEMVAIARRPGVLSKVAIRAASATLMPLSVGIGADHIARVRQQLDGERIQVVVWQRAAAAYIVGALGLSLGEIPPVQLLPGIQHARVLLGEIDVRGISGWRGLNTLLASALTGWRIRLEPVAATASWRRLEMAMHARTSVLGTIIGRTERGLRVEVLGLNAILSGSSDASPRPGGELMLRVMRLNADEGRIFVSDRLATRGQLSLPLL